MFPNNLLVIKDHARYIKAHLLVQMDRYLHTLKRWSRAAVLLFLKVSTHFVAQRPGTNVSGYANNDPFAPEGVL